MPFVNTNGVLVPIKSSISMSFSPFKIQKSQTKLLNYGSDSQLEVKRTPVAT